MNSSPRSLNEFHSLICASCCSVCDADDHDDHDEEILIALLLLLLIIIIIIIIIRKQPDNPNRWKFVEEKGGEKKKPCSFLTCVSAIGLKKEQVTLTLTLKEIKEKQKKQMEQAQHHSPPIGIPHRYCLYSFLILPHSVACHL